MTHALLRSALRSAAATFVFSAAVGLVMAQTGQTPPAGAGPSETSTQPKAPAEQNPSAQHTQQDEAKDPAASQVAPGEPKAVATPQTGPAFVNGALAASAAGKDSQTVPAKYSAKNDAEDHLPLLAYALKNLSDDQRRAIVDSVKDAKTSPPKGTAPPEAYAKPSMQLPSSTDIRGLPDAITKEVPALKAYRYCTVGDQVLLVEPTNMTVVAVLGQ